MFSRHPSSAEALFSRSICQTTHVIPRRPHPSQIATQTRHARLIKRPKRPYQFTQLLTLSDGSTVLHRTTSPVPVFVSKRDTRNSPAWNPSSAKLAAVEEDRAGRLRSFRRRFGRGWDSETPEQAAAAGSLTEATEIKDDGSVEETGVENQKGRGGVADAHQGRVKSDSGWSQQEEDNLLDLISNYGKEGEKEGQAKGGTADGGRGRTGK